MVKAKRKITKKPYVVQEKIGKLDSWRTLKKFSSRNTAQRFMASKQPASAYGFPDWVMRVKKLPSKKSKGR